MLIRFIAENFGSIKDRVEFSMAASKVARHPGHVHEVSGKRILRSSFIFGANAGGKTTFFRAMRFAVDVIRKGVRHVSCANRAFKLGDKLNDKGMFQFDFIVDGHVYSYGFVISYNSVSIVAEWLYLCDDAKKSVCLFNRETEKGGVRFETDLTVPELDPQWYSFYKNDFAGGDNSQVLALNDLNRRQSQGNLLVEHARRVRTFFRRFVMIAPDDAYGNGFYLHGDADSQLRLEEYLRLFDTGITKIILKELVYDEVVKTLPPPVRDELQHDFQRVLEGNKRKIHLTATVSNNQETLFFDVKNGKIRVRQLLFEHGKKGVFFERLEESDGTRRLFDLLPLLLLLKSGAIVFVDEIDRSLHTKATTEFIRRFLEQTDRNGSQLIATTHDGELLDLDLLRQDEIWFVERDDNHVSHLYPLSRFNARFDSKVKKDYLLGRYGALPIFGRLGEIET